VDVFRHQHEADEFDIEFLAGGVDREAQSPTPIVICQ
jgi:hypothetical protein